MSESRKPTWPEVVQNSVFLLFAAVTILGVTWLVTR